ncbi:hypothetical protein ABZX51_009033 [Aspergillus tubingensis]
MPEEYTRGRSRGRLPSSEFDRAPSLQRSLSPRSESRFNTTPRRRSVERGAVRRNGHRSRSWSRSPSHNRALSRSRSRSRSSAPRRYRKKDFSRTPSPSADASRNSKIVIEKLTKNVTESHLREIFGGFGDIQSLDLPMNKAFMTNRGTAYILYHDPADAEAAIAHMHEAQLDGATLNFNIAEQALAAQDMAADPCRIVALQGHRHRLGNIAVLGIWKDMTSIGLALCRAPGRHAALDPFLQNPVQLHHRQGGHTRVWTAPNVAVAVARATAAMAIAVAAIGNGARA